jgi:hypothetical protein
MIQPDDTVGYCAVVCPKIDFWQGYFICDIPELREGAAMAQMLSLALVSADQANPFGSLQAALTQCAIEAETGKVGALALALKSASKEPFFIILADVGLSGTTTQMIPLKATNVEEARKEIDDNFEVRQIKKRLLTKMVMRDGSGRREQFH